MSSSNSISAYWLDVSQCAVWTLHSEKVSQKVVVGLKGHGLYSGPRWLGIGGGYYSTLLASFWDCNQRGAFSDGWVLSWTKNICFHSNQWSHFLPNTADTLSCASDFCSWGTVCFAFLLWLQLWGTDNGLRVYAAEDFKILRLRRELSRFNLGEKTASILYSLFLHILSGVAVNCISSPLSVSFLCFSLLK